MSSIKNRIRNLIDETLPERVQAGPKFNNITYEPNNIGIPSQAKNSHWNNVTVFNEKRYRSVTNNNSNKNTINTERSNSKEQFRTLYSNNNSNNVSKINNDMSYSNDFFKFKSQF